MVLPGSGQLPQMLTCKMPEDDADTQHGGTETHECLSSNMGCRVNHALGEAVQHIQQLLKPPRAAGLLQHLALSQTNHSAGHQHCRGKGWATPCEAPSQGGKKPKTPCGSCCWHPLSFRLYLQTW